MPNAMVALATTTLGSTASSVTFGSIPATYRDLRVIVNCAVTAEGNIQLQVNNDTGNNYGQLRFSGYAGSSINSTATTTTSVVTNVATGMQTSSRGLNIYDIFDYAQTDKQKVILCKGYHSDELDVISARWANTSAITSVKVLAGSNFTVGTTISLYGIVS